MPDLLTAELRAPRAGCYARHTIAADPAGRFTLLSIVWAPGQFSPPHAHDTWCAYAVAENPLDRDALRVRRAEREGIAVAIQRCASRAMLVSPRPGLNKSTGLVMPGRWPAISLHVYGVEGSRVGTHVNRLMDVAERER